MMKKRLMATVLAGAMVLSVTACGDKGGNEASTQPAADNTQSSAADTGSEAAPEAEAPAEPTGPV